MLDWLKGGDRLPVGLKDWVFLFLAIVNLIAGFVDIYLSNESFIFTFLAPLNFFAAFAAIALQIIHLRDIYRN